MLAVVDAFRKPVFHFPNAWNPQGCQNSLTADLESSPSLLAKVAKAIKVHFVLAFNEIERASVGVIPVNRSDGGSSTSLSCSLMRDIQLSSEVPEECIACCFDGGVYVLDLV